MVESWINSELDAAHIVLRPNRSWTWRANLGFVASLAVVSVVVGLTFLLRGMWLILPFNLLEVGVLYLCLRYLLRRTRRQEVIRFTDDEVRVECGATEPDCVTCFERPWTQILVEAPRRTRRRRIALRTRGHEQEIGAFLNDDDQLELVRELRRLVNVFGTPAHIRAQAFASASAARSAVR